MKYSRIFYITLLGIGLFLLLIESALCIKGFVGLLMCILGVYLIVGTTIKILSFFAFFNTEKIKEIDIMRFL